MFLWGIVWSIMSPRLPPSEAASPLEIIIIDQGLPQGGRPSSGWADCPPPPNLHSCMLLVTDLSTNFWSCMSYRQTFSIDLGYGLDQYRWLHKCKVINYWIRVARALENYNLELQRRLEYFVPSHARYILYYFVRWMYHWKISAATTFQPMFAMYHMQQTQGRCWYKLISGATIGMGQILYSDVTSLF